MENIIKKAIEGGYVCLQGEFWDKNDFNYAVLDKNFWQALGKACGWEPELLIDDEGLVRNMVNSDMLGVIPGYYKEDSWVFYSSRFYRINLTEGWDKAIKYLESLLD